MKQEIRIAIVTGRAKDGRVRWHAGGSPNWTPETMARAYVNALRDELGEDAECRSCIAKIEVEFPDGPDVPLPEVTGAVEESEA